MMLDLTITAGNLIEVATICIGGVVVFVTLRGTVVQLGKDVSELKMDIRMLNKIVTSMAVADQRIAAVEQDIRAVEQDLRELRHGRGFIREGIEREYPGSK